MFESLYELRNEYAFGANLCADGPLRYGVETLVAQYPKNNPDGQDVDIYCTAMPARFYKIVAYDSFNSIGGAIHGFTLGTGSSQERLAAEIAEAITNGMLSIKIGEE